MLATLALILFVYTKAPPISHRENAFVPRCESRYSRQLTRGVYTSIDHQSQTIVLKLSKELYYLQSTTPIYIFSQTPVPVILDAGLGD